MSKLSPTKKAIKSATATIAKLKKELTKSILNVFKEKKVKSIELTLPVTINMVNSNNFEEITHVGYTGNISIKNSYGSFTKGQHIDDLDVSQLYDLLIQLDENDVFEEEVG